MGLNKAIVTGAGGLIGSEVVKFLLQRNIDVVGIDNNMRADFFGEKGDTTWNIHQLETQYPSFKNHNIDIRSREQVLSFVSDIRPDAIIHTAAQPSHDLAASRPFDDFDVNALGTLNLLEANRRVNVNTPFVHLSTNKVYGDAPNHLNIVEKETRYEYGDQEYFHGIKENFPVDQSRHSLFGASKLAADVMVQEYGQYFGMPSCCLRGGCLTGPNHSGVELHGFLSYLIRCNVYETEYTVYGYKGKQVRDNIHAFDVASFIWEFLQAPGIAEVYNIGGGRDNSISILEAFQLIESISGKQMNYAYSDQSRIGDHICYISDLSKIQAHFPKWEITKDLRITFREIYESWLTRKKC
jgi:CDP-paratose 2-epimerase